MRGLLGNRGGCLLAFLVGAALGTLWPTPTHAYPKPHVIPRGWLLEIEFQTPRCIAVRLPGDRHDTYYWYATYTVTNKTGEDHNLIPEIVLLSDAGDMIQANSNLPPRVFETLRKALRNPLLKSPTEIAGRIMQGADNAVDGIAIWPMPDHDVNEVRIFFQGLCGETYDEVDPANGQIVKLHRSLVLEYETPGSVEKQPMKPWIDKNDPRSPVWAVR